MNNNHMNDPALFAAFSTRIIIPVPTVAVQAKVANDMASTFSDLLVLGRTDIKDFVANLLAQNSTVPQAQRLTFSQPLQKSLEAVRFELKSRKICDVQ